MKPIETDPKLTAKWKRARRRPTIIFTTGALVAILAMIVAAGTDLQNDPYPGLFIVMLGAGLFLLSYFVAVRAEGSAYRIRELIHANRADAWANQINDRYGLTLTKEQAEALLPRQVDGAANAPRVVATLDLPAQLEGDVLRERELTMVWTGEGYELFERRPDGEFRMLPVSSPPTAGSQSA